jgi:hypothetical protein
MEKQIFIELKTLSKFNLLGVTTSDLQGELNICNLLYLGLVNHLLGNKANCKEIISVKRKAEYDGYVLKEWYEITYLESKMIASKDDLESAFKEGEQWKQFRETGYPTDAIRFNDWFNEKF